MNSVRIELLGTSFSIQTDEDPEYIEKLVERIGRDVESLRSQTKTEDPLKLAILASIMLADEAFAQKDAPEGGSPRDQHGGEENDEAERIALRLISDIDDRLTRS
jgi:cell division protein ZapA (FtsZ GTPase activity inhibitor)